MQSTLYNPFKTFDFKSQKCFLSGEAYPSPLAITAIIPDWLMEQANLTGEEQIKLLDESIRTYRSLTVPCSEKLIENEVGALEKEVAEAFAKGFEGVSQLSEQTLFNWIGKMMYGFLYVEMQGAIRTNQLDSDGINMSQGLIHKFKNLHMMVQSIFRTVEFEDFKPWSILVVPLTENVNFSFRDEINTLTFSLKFRDFGIIACLQDNGTNARFHGEILEAIAGKKITEQQFEEICARFFYSAYLFNRLPEYSVMEVHGTTYIEAMPLSDFFNKPLFDTWANKTYGQVLENFWKPWDHTLFEIIKDPNNPMSYFDEPKLPAS